MTTCRAAAIRRRLDEALDQGPGLSDHVPGAGGGDLRQAYGLRARASSAATEIALVS